MSQPIDWQHIYKQQSPKLLGICRRYIKEISIAEDIIQDAFIIAIQKNEVLKNKQALLPWLTKIVINQSLQYLRKNKQLISIEDETALTDKMNLEMESKEIYQQSAILASSLDANDIVEAIDKLPIHHKTVFNMYMIDNYSHNEISNVLNIPINTSKSHLLRAKTALQKFLSEKAATKEVNNKKRRLIVILFYFGLSDYMFSMFYKKSFKNFEIPLSKPVESNNIFSSKLSFTKSPSFLKSSAGLFTITGGTLATLLIIYNLNTISFQKKEKVKENKIVVQTNKEKKNKITNHTKSLYAKNSNSKEIKPNQVIQTYLKKNLKKENEITTIGTKQNVQEAITENISNKEIKKDTLTTKENQAPVIVKRKRKIIKRDTIYVEK
ncbi:MAG: RNA polymerase sigma factor [Limnohabitans sp.]|nr:RNA polymerase sigma factor [Limnohabitans sp.]